MDPFVKQNIKPTLCLNMIVKNESKIITRLFDSVIQIIDCYCICDTGSSDDTVNIINEYFNSKNIPGKVVFEPFKNFCHNRNVALKSCLGMSDYILLLDADMILEIKNFDKSSLFNADSFHILQGNDSFYYQNMRIVKNNGLYSYSGVTHEYINTPPNNCVKGFEKTELFIRDVGDGGSKQNKFERDVKLLLDGIKEEPNNVRYHFYLANSYHDSGNYEEAINIYKKRIEMGGWQEEVWYSYYRIGSCFQNMGKMNDANHYWMEGYNYYPQRLEGLYEMIKHYRINSKHKLANLFYQEALRILKLGGKRDDYLFLHEDVYTSKLYYEYTIFSCYNGVKNINNEIIKVLNNSKDESIMNNLLENMKFYKDVLLQKSKRIFDNKIISNINNEDIELFSSSSCLIPNNDGVTNGYIMNVRYVNYYINEHGNYLKCDKNIITVNKYVELDKNLNPISEKWMELQFNNRRYIGVEDVRLFHDYETNNLLFIGTGFHKNNNIGIVSGNYDVDSRLLKDNEIKPTFCKSDCEKNWVFVDYKNSTHIIYKWGPLQICKINDTNNELTLIESREMPPIFNRIRGSTCGFKYSKKINYNATNGVVSDNKDNISIDILEEEIWFVTHIVSYEQPRHYYHVIVVFDANMKLLRYSAPFKFEGECIEYCLSIVVEDERVLMNYSTWDRSTRVGIYAKEYIDDLVKYT